MITTTMDRNLLKVDKASAVSARANRANRANLAKLWHEESAAKWITTYAAQLSPRSQLPPNTERP